MRKFNLNTFFTVQTSVLLAFSAFCLNAQQRSEAEVMGIAKTFHWQSMSSGANRAPKFNAEEIRLTPSSQLINGYGLRPANEAFYICADDSDGFVIVSGDERMPEVLGYSASGQFDPANMPPSLKYVLECYASQKENLKNTQYLSPLAKASVGPLISTKWDQSDPYNRLCPMDGGRRSVTGCVATAMAQVMNYHQYPSCGTGTINYQTQTKNINVSLDLADYPFDWNNMLDIYENGHFNSTQANAVAKLMYAAGAASKMDYTNDQSGTSDYYAFMALAQNFGYDQDLFFLKHDNCTDEQWVNCIVNELNASRPILFGGQSPEGGHEFVIDGYKNLDGWLYLSVNWGWSGYYNGDFLITDLKPEGQGIGGFEGGYNEGQDIILNFMPENNTYDNTYVLSGESISVTPSAFESNQVVDVTISLNNIYNYSSRLFDGVLRFTLADEGGNEWIIGDYGLNIDPQYGFGQLPLTANLGTLQDGFYTMKVYTVSNESGSMSPVLTASGFPTFSVGQETIDTDFTPTLTASAITIDESVSSGYSLGVKLSDIANWEETSFYGEIALALIPTGGEEQYILDGGHLIISQSNAIGQYKYMPGQHNVGIATIPESLEPGTYDVYAVARQQNCSYWSIISGYNVETGESYDLSTQVDITDYGLKDESIDTSYLPDVSARSITFDSGESSGFKLSANIDQVLNWAEDKFYGKLALAIADMDGSNLRVLEGGQYEMTASNGLEQYYYKVDPIHIGASTIPADVAPGYYLIYAVAKQMGCDGWKVLKGYDIELGTNYELYSFVQVTAQGAVLNAYDPVGDPAVSGNVVVDYTGGSYSGGLISEGTKLKWKIYNLSDQDITLIGAYMTDGTTGVRWGNYINTSVLRAGQSATHSLRVESGGIHNPKVTFEYLYNGYRYFAETAIDEGSHVASVTATATTGGTINASAKMVVKGQSATFTMSPNQKYYLAKVTNNDEDVTEDVVDYVYTVNNIQNDIRVKAFFEKNKHQLTYMLDDEIYHQEMVAVDASISLLPDPTKEGYIFSGWTGYPANLKMPDEDVTITGSFSIATYQLTYYVDDVVYATEDYTYGASITPLADLEREGYTFSGWNGLPEDLKMPAHDVLVLGSFTVNTYTLTYIIDNEVFYEEQLPYHAQIVLIDGPVREGYDFTGWSGYPADLLMPAYDLIITGNYELGIADILQDVTNNFVYDIHGHLVSTTGLNELPNGLYIVDGKKVLIK